MNTKNYYARLCKNSFCEIGVAEGISGTKAGERKIERWREEYASH